MKRIHWDFFHLWDLGHLIQTTGKQLTSAYPTVDQNDRSCQMTMGHKTSGEKTTSRFLVVFFPTFWGARSLGSLAGNRVKQHVVSPESFHSLRQRWPKIRPHGTIDYENKPKRWGTIWDLQMFKIVELCFFLRRIPSWELALHPLPAGTFESMTFRTPPFGGILLVRQIKICEMRRSKCWNSPIHPKEIASVTIVGNHLECKVP